MKNRIFAGILTVCTATTLYGCADVDGNNSVIKQDEQSSSNNSADSEIEMNVSEKKEHPTKCKIYRQTAVNFTEEQLLSFFSETPERTFYRESNTAVYTAETEHGNTSGNSLNFLTDTGSLCMMAYGAVFKEEQIKSVKKNPYNLNESEMQKEIEAAERIAKRKSKDFYYIELRPQFDEIPTYSGYAVHHGEHDRFVVPASCEICFSADGIESFSVSNIAKTQTFEEVEIIPFDKAKELILKKYDSIIFDGEVAVNSVELVYMAIPQNDLGEIASRFETRPFYAFHCTITEERGGKTVSENITTYFDAVTGDEFATEQIMLGG